PWVHTGIALQPGHDEWNHNQNARDPIDPSQPACVAQETVWTPPSFR
ncbi:MAG: hypothetical protein HW394_1738, partial [Acidobacteria bacterium]|nr:hypothetical protein [Acidobacteriota bacterium]